ncbi:hypothetical protein ANN_23977 [Periplaneta americana]|uniref:Uncharacterized protein n=1 Tax=Periplaneta americana TaxID=6978 RepID=A0ABQ8S1T9_PERAM|nr:hypothetical protein ANN_23977 [Periplaneta americana]
MITQEYSSSDASMQLAFPKDVKRRMEWTKAVRRENWCPTYYSIVCSAHFKDEDFDRSSLCYVRIKEDAVPSLYPAFPTKVQQKMKSIMDTVKVEIDSNTESNQESNAFQLSDIKYEDSFMPTICEVKSEVKDNTYIIKVEPLQTEQDDFLISVKEEEIWETIGIKQEEESDTSLQEHEPPGSMGFLLDGGNMKENTAKQDVSNECNIVFVCDKKDNHAEENHIFATVATDVDRECEKPFRCKICKKRFSKRGSLAQHSRSHSGGRRQFICDFCNKHFSQRGHLMEHVRIHTGEKPYVCETCNRGFSQHGHLSSHIKTHTGVKPYKCDICKKKFSSSRYLVVHTRNHSVRKPFKCKLCEKSFIQRKDFQRHSRGHRGAKSYKCEICNEQFPDQNSLARHRRTHAESIHRYVSWKVSNNMEGTLSPALEGHLLAM